MCGIVGLRLKNELASKINVLSLVNYALYQLTHRGQEGAGYAWSVGKSLESYKDFGYADAVYGEMLRTYQSKNLITHQAIGHVRYPTQGPPIYKNLQPIMVSSHFGRLFSLVSNGNLTDYPAERQIMEGGKDRFDFESSSEAELILRKIIDHHVKERQKNNGGEADFIKSIMFAIEYFKGAFSSILMTRNNMFAFMDRFGFRPLWFGETDDFCVFASELCALDILGIRVDKRQELRPGQIYHLSDNGLNIYQYAIEQINTKYCIFEMIYFARPDSVQWGMSVYKYRQELGRLLAQKDPDLDFDLIVPVPDSANFIAMGYAQQKGTLEKFMQNALIRNHYIGRTFIKPDQTVRNESVRRKFNPLPEIFLGKKIVLVDDSIVRGTTIRKIVSMIFKAGAREIHLRIGSPPKRYPCFYGIATPTHEEHAWRKFHGLEGLIRYILEPVQQYIRAGGRFTLKYLDYKICSGR